MWLCLCLWLWLPGLCNFRALVVTNMSAMAMLRGGTQPTHHQMALNSETRQVDEARAVAMAKHTVVAWNASDFEVHYPTVASEIKVGRYFLRYLCFQDDASGRVGIPHHLPKDYMPQFLLHLYMRIIGDGRHCVRLACARTMLLALMKSESHIVPLSFLGSLLRIMYASNVQECGDALAALRKRQLRTASASSSASAGGGSGTGDGGEAGTVAAAAAAANSNIDAAIDAARFPSPAVHGGACLSPPLAVTVQSVLVEAVWRSMQLNANVTRWARSGGIEATLMLLLRAVSSGWDADFSVGMPACDPTDPYTGGWLFQDTPITGIDIAIQCIKVLRRAVRASTYVIDAAEAAARNLDEHQRRTGRGGGGAGGRGKTRWHTVPVSRVRARLGRPDMLAMLVQLLSCPNPRVCRGVIQLLSTVLDPSLKTDVMRAGLFHFLLQCATDDWTQVASLLFRLHQRPSLRLDMPALHRRAVAHGVAGDEASASVLLKPLASSCLLPLLPEAIVRQLLQPNGEQLFASAFASVVFTPEMMWTAEMREHMQAHLRAFIAESTVTVRVRVVVVVVVVVWLCGCVVVWLCGCVVVWLCGCACACDCACDCDCGCGCGCGCGCVAVWLCARLACSPHVDGSPPPPITLHGNGRHPPQPTTRMRSTCSCGPRMERRSRSPSSTPCWPPNLSAAATTYARCALRRTACLGISCTPGSSSKPSLAA